MKSEREPGMVRLAVHLVGTELARQRLVFSICLGVWGLHGLLLVSAATAVGGTDFIGPLAVTQQACALIEFLLSLVVTAQIVHSDPLVGTAHFWMTKPISRTALLVSKLSAIAILLVVIPAAVDGFAALSMGMSAPGTWSVALVAAQRQALIVGPALAIASVTSDGARFSFAFILLAAGFLAGLWIDGLTFSHLSPGGTGLALRPASLWRIAMMVTAAVVVLHQYLTLRRGRSVTLLVAGVVCVALSVNHTPAASTTEPKSAAFTVTASIERGSERAERVSAGLGQDPSDWVNVYARLLYAGYPATVVVWPARLHTFVGDQSKEYRTVRVSYDSRDEAQPAVGGPMEAAALASVGGQQWTVLGHVERQVPGILLSRLSVADYGRATGSSLQIKGLVLLRAFVLGPAAMAPVRVQAPFGGYKRTGRIVGLSRAGDYWRLELRETALEAQYPEIDATYLLRNRATREVVFGTGRQMMVFGPLLPITPNAMFVRRTMLTFHLTPRQGEGPTDPERWVRDAELVRVEAIGPYTLHSLTLRDQLVLPALDR